MPRKPSLHARATLAISDAKRRAQYLLALDGAIDADDQECLLLMDHAAALLQLADYGRRIAHNLEDYCDVTDGLKAEIAQFERDFADVLVLDAA